MSLGFLMLWTTQGYGRCKQLKDLDDMSYSKSGAQGSGCYEQPRVVNDMKDSRSLDLRPLDAMNDSRIWLTWMTMGHEHKALDALKHLELPMIRTIEYPISSGH